MIPRDRKVGFVFVSDDLEGMVTGKSLSFINNARRPFISSFSPLSPDEDLTKLQRDNVVIVGPGGFQES